MRLRLCMLLVLVALAGQAQAQTTVEIAGSTLTIGASPTSPSGSTVRLTGLATSGGDGVLLSTASGDLVKRALAKADLPGTVGYTDEAETWALLQTFSSGFSAGASSSVTGTLTATTLAATGAATVGTTLGVTGLATLTGGYSAGASSSIAGNLSLTGTGAITAAGDAAINGGDLTSTGALVIRPTGNLTLDPTGDVLLGPDGADVLPTSGYAVHLGALTSKYLSLHAAELWVETLVAQDTIATIGGRILVGPTTQLTADLTAGATSITVKHNSLANGDRVYLEAAGAVEFLAITSAASGSAGAYVYSVTRSLDPSGANAWTAGDAVFNTGTTGSGFIDLYSVRGVKASSEIGPTIVGNVRQSATYNDWSARWAIGNLNGLYSYGANEYGAAFGSPAGQHLTIDATNGVRNRSGATTWSQFSASGLTLGVTATGNGNIFADTSGNLYFRSGSTNKITMSAGTGDLTLTGNIELSTGGDIKSTGNFSLTAANGFKIESSTTGIGGGGDAAKRLWFAGGGSVYQFADDVIISAITASSGSPTVNLFAQRGACGTGITCFAYFEVIPSTATATTRTQFVLTGSQTTSVGEAYYEVLRGDSAGSLSIGTSTIYLGAIHWNGAQTTVAGYPMIWDGPTNQIVAKSDGVNGTCAANATLTVEYGIITAC